LPELALAAVQDGVSVGPVGTVAHVTPVVSVQEDTPTTVVLFWHSLAGCTV